MGRYYDPALIYWLPVLAGLYSLSVITSPMEQYSGRYSDVVASGGASDSIRKLCSRYNYCSGRVFHS